MSEKITFAAEPRAVQGSSASRRLRREGIVPAVIYADGKKARQIQLPAHEFEMLLRHHTGESLLLDLHVKGAKPCMALLRDVQHHPVNGQVMHVDMQEVSAKKKLRVPISLELVGEPAGVAHEGGVLEHLLHSIEVECLPADLVEKVELDVSALKIGDSLSVSDIDLDTSRYSLLTAGDIAVAIVAAPRVADEDVAEEEGEEVAAEGEEMEEGEGSEEG